MKLYVSSEVIFDFLWYVLFNVQWRRQDLVRGRWHKTT